MPKNNINMRLRDKKGFTLLELLVVISIIGILIALGVVAFSTAQQKSRDARRRADIKALRDGFEQYYASNSGGYGTCEEMMGSTTDIFPGGAPQDPKQNADYECGTANGGYCVCANLETGGGNAADTPCPVYNGMPGDAAANANWFCMGNLQ